MNDTQWHGCYSDSWQGVITPDAFAHPAKYARGLIRRIYQHMRARGYIMPGDRVVDPFGGIAAGAVDAMSMGLHWYGCELEPHFVALGNANIAKWRRDLTMWGDRVGGAYLLQGDSRYLASLLGGGMSAAVSSPPYADAVNGTGEGPGARHDPIHHNGDNAHKVSSANGYGATPGNLGNLSGDGFQAAVSSPPYSATGVEFTKTGLKKWQPGYSKFSGHEQGPYGAKPEVDLYNEHAYMSPEWLKRRKDTARQQANIALLPDTAIDPEYPTFWSAARAIVEQTYAVLRPGGYAVWVCKDFVRKGQRVPFSDQWQQLCEAVGFEPVERIAAMLVADHGDQLDIFGGATARLKERKSFFRRLAEKKGSPRIDHEDVIILRKPL